MKTRYCIVGGGIAAAAAIEGIRAHDREDGRSAEPAQVQRREGRPDRMVALPHLDRHGLAEARQKPVQFAYQLTEDASVEFRILDASGHEVARFARSGRRSDNLETWDPVGLPAGLYMARLRFAGPGGARTESLPLGILR